MYVDNAIKNKKVNNNLHRKRMIFYRSTAIFRIIQKRAYPVNQKTTLDIFPGDFLCYLPPGHYLAQNDRNEITEFKITPEFTVIKIQEYQADKPLYRGQRII